MFSIHLLLLLLLLLHHHSQVLEHPWMTQCASKPTVNEIEDQVKQFVGGQMKKADETTLLGQVLLCNVCVCMWPVYVACVC